MVEIKGLRKSRKWNSRITDLRRAQLYSETAGNSIGSNIKAKRS